MSSCSPSGCDQGHVTHFYILDLENFATASHSYIGVVNKLSDGQLMDYTYDSQH